MARLFDDGSTEYLELDLTPASSEPLTMACWFYSDDATVDQTLVSVADKDSANVFHALRLSGTVAGDPVRAYSSILGTIYHASTSSGFSANTWHHGCGVFAASDDRRVYIDGGSKGTDANDLEVPGLNRVSVGRTGDSTPVYYMSGRIADVAVWNVALTDAEVAILAKGYSPLYVKPGSLVAYWPLIRDTDNDIVGGYDLTAYNTPSTASHPPAIFGRAPIFAVVPSAAAAAAAGYMTPMRGYWGT